MLLWHQYSSSRISVGAPANFCSFVVAIRDKLQLDVWQIQLLLNAFRMLVVMISFLMEVDLGRDVSDHRMTGNRRKSCRSRCAVGGIFTLWLLTGGITATASRSPGFVVFN